METGFKMAAKLGILIWLSLLLTLSEGCLKKSSSGGSDPEPQGQDQDNDKDKSGEQKSGGSKPNGDDNQKKKGKLRTIFLTNCYKKGQAPYSEGIPELYISKDGGGLEELLPDYEYGDAENVEISTNGKYIAYSKRTNPDNDTTRDVYVMRLSDRKETRITENKVQDSHPSFINNEQGEPEWVVWFSVRNGTASLFARPINLSEVEYNISPNLNAVYSDPEVSANGDKIVYVYNDTNYECATVIQVADIEKDNNGRISLTNPSTISGGNGQNEKIITRTDPTWNSDASKILYDIYDVDLKNASREDCWDRNGLKDGYQQNWKIVLYDLKSGERKVVFESGKGDPANLLPIWIDDTDFLAMGMHVSGGGISFKVYRINSDTGERSTYRSDTDDCAWIDYVRFYE